jgi:hypothetical protein
MGLAHLNGHPLKDVLAGHDQLPRLVSDIERRDRAPPIGVNFRDGVGYGYGVVDAHALEEAQPVVAEGHCYLAALGARRILACQ